MEVKVIQGNNWTYSIVPVVTIYDDNGIFKCIISYDDKYYENCLIEELYFQLIAIYNSIQDSLTSQRYKKKRLIVFSNNLNFLSELIKRCSDNCYVDRNSMCVREIVIKFSKSRSAADKICIRNLSLLTDYKEIFCLNLEEARAAHKEKVIETKKLCERENLAELGSTRIKNIMYRIRNNWKECPYETPKLYLEENGSSFYTSAMAYENPMYANIEIKNVKSYDISSSYISCILTELFPIGEPIHIFKKECEGHTLEEIFELAKKKNQFAFIKLSSPNFIDNIIISSADYKWLLHKNFFAIDYCIESIDIFNAEHLPKAFVEAIIPLYERKCAIKGRPQYKDEYKSLKAQLNAVFGLNLREKLLDKNENWKNEYLPFSYLWGYSTLAYARSNLAEILDQMPEYNFVSCDTDSVKYINTPGLENLFYAYNQRMEDRVKKALKFYELESPLTSETLGKWEPEIEAETFKFLRTKCYMYEDREGELHTTIAGCPKSAVNYFKQFDEPFKMFTYGTVIPYEFTRLVKVYKNKVYKLDYKIGAD